jgi:sodium-dependent dicarboxylate transporter 2/3/5
MAGLMSVTAFLSMWINNSAATSIMIPAAIAIVDELENYEKKIFSNQEQSHDIIPIDTESNKKFLRDINQ